MSTLASGNFERIWLEPREGADPYIGRQWCQDNQWGEDGVEYVRADLAVKSLEWREDWGGSLDDIPGWRAATPFGPVSASIAGHRDPQGRRYLKHADIPADLINQLQWTAEVAYRGRILSALRTWETKANAE